MTKAFDKRLSSLESAVVETRSGIDLDALSDAELERLEVIIQSIEAGTKFDDLPDDDVQYVAALRCVPCE